MPITNFREREAEAPNDDDESNTNAIMYNGYVSYATYDAYTDSSNGNTYY